MTAGGSLALPGKQPASKEQAQELMLKFKELKRTANRDMSTLNSLEGSLLSRQLEQARQTDPWELISTPTLIDKPVGPWKLRIVAYGLLSGFVLGCGAALINERRIGLVHSEEELKHSFTCNLLERLELKHTNTWTTACELLAKGPLSEAQTIALVPVGQPDSNALNVSTKALQIALGDRFAVSSDLRKLVAVIFKYCWLNRVLQPQATWPSPTKPGVARHTSSRVAIVGFHGRGGVKRPWQFVLAAVGTLLVANNIASATE